MSVEIANGGDDQRDNNETELRELVYQSLEHDGLITRLKAQLRAAVFKTIEKASNPSDIPSTPAQEGTTERVCRALVLDWLEHSNFLYTHDLLKVETSSSNRSEPLTQTELLDQLHLESPLNKSQSILQLLVNAKPTQSTKIVDLPDAIKQSIDSNFPTEKINDINRIRDHFRSLFSSTFDPTVLNAFLIKILPSSTTTIPKIDYEQICLKWLQSCAKVLTIQPNPIKETTSLIPIQPFTTRNGTSNGQTITQARRSFSPPSDSNSSSSSTSHSENPRKNPFDFPLPTTLSTKKPSELPPPLLNLNNNNNSADEDESSSSLFSKQHATPAALNHLKNIEEIIREDSTTRSRTTIIEKNILNGNKDIPIEYDDESVSQSQMSSVDDVTVDKASPSPSANIDFLEDF